MMTLSLWLMVTLVAVNVTLHLASQSWPLDKSGVWPIVGPQHGHVVPLVASVDNPIQPHVWSE